MRGIRRRASVWFFCSQNMEKPLSKVIATSWLPTRFEGAVKWASAQGLRAVGTMRFLPGKGSNTLMWRSLFTSGIVCVKVMAQRFLRMRAGVGLI